MTDELIWLTASELADMYRSKTVSPVEVVDAVIARAEHVQPVLNNIVTFTTEQARAEAKQAERRFANNEEDLPPLFGVPITVKDLTDTAGVRTTYGCVAYADHVPDLDAIAWARLKAAGTIMIGKTCTPEFGLLGVTQSKLTGTTGNPYDPSKTAGGSSGGAAASTVAGVAPLAWGSDGGGSIRVPSSVCGAVGIKPSWGRIPFRGNDDPDTTEGPITRSVLDAAMMLDATAGHHPDDRLSIPSSGERYADAARAEGDLSGLRVAASPDLGQGPIDPEVRAAFGQALDDLRAAGAVVEVVEVDLPDPNDFFVSYWGPEYMYFADEMRAEGIELWSQIQELADRARAVSPLQVSNAMRRIKNQIYAAYASVFQSFDLFVIPTTPTPAFPHNDQGGAAVVDGVEVAVSGLFFHRLTESPSHAWLPAISVPGGFTTDGLPVGLQFIGPLYADAATVAAAARYERATAWHRRHPHL